MSISISSIFSSFCSSLYIAGCSAHFSMANATHWSDVLCGGPLTAITCAVSIFASVMFYHCAESGSRTPVVLTVLSIFSSFTLQWLRSRDVGTALYMSTRDFRRGLQLMVLWITLCLAYCAWWKVDYTALSKGGYLSALCRTYLPSDWGLYGFVYQVIVGAGSLPLALTANSLQLTPVAVAPPPALAFPAAPPVNNFLSRVWYVARYSVCRFANATIVGCYISYRIVRLLILALWLVNPLVLMTILVTRFLPARMVRSIRMVLTVLADPAVREALSLAMSRDQTLFSGTPRDVVLRLVVGFAASKFPEFKDAAHTLRLNVDFATGQTTLVEPIVRAIVAVVMRKYGGKYLNGFQMLLGNLGFNRFDLVVSSAVEMYYGSSSLTMLTRTTAADMAKYTRNLQTFGLPFELQASLISTGVSITAIHAPNAVSGYVQVIRHTRDGVNVADNVYNRALGAIIGWSLRHVHESVISPVAAKAWGKSSVHISFESIESKENHAKLVEFYGVSRHVNIAKFGKLDEITYSTDGTANTGDVDLGLNRAVTTLKEKIKETGTDLSPSEFISLLGELTKDEADAVIFRGIVDSGMDLGMVDTYSRALYSKGQDKKEIHENLRSAMMLHVLLDLQPTAVSKELIVDSFSVPVMYKSFFPNPDLPPTDVDTNVRLIVARQVSSNVRKDAGAVAENPRILFERLSKQMSLMSFFALAKSTGRPLSSAQVAIDKTKTTFSKVIEDFRSHLKLARDRVPSPVGKHAPTVDFEDLVKSLTTYMDTWTATEKGPKTIRSIPPLPVIPEEKKKNDVHKADTKVKVSPDDDKQIKIKPSASSGSGGVSKSVSFQDHSPRTGANKPKQSKFASGVRSAPHKGGRNNNKDVRNRLRNAGIHSGRFASVHAQSGESLGDEDGSGNTYYQDRLIDEWERENDREMDDALGGDDRANFAGRTFEDFMLSRGLVLESDAYIKVVRALSNSLADSKCHDEIDNILLECANSLDYDSENSLEDIVSICANCGQAFFCSAYPDGHCSFEHEAIVKVRPPDFFTVNGCVLSAFFGDIEDETRYNKTCCVHIPSSYTVFPLDLFVSKEVLCQGSVKKAKEEYARVLSKHSHVRVSNGAHHFPIDSRMLVEKDGVCSIQATVFRGCVVGAVVLRSRCVPVALSNRPKNSLSLKCNLETDAKKKRNRPSNVLAAIPRRVPGRSGTCSLVDVTGCTPVHMSEAPLIIHDVNTEPGDCGSPFFYGNQLYAIHVAAYRQGGVTKNLAFILQQEMMPDPLVVSGHNVSPDEEDADFDIEHEMAVMSCSFEDVISRAIVEAEEFHSNSFDCSDSTSIDYESLDFLKTLKSKVPSEFCRVFSRNHNCVLPPGEAEKQMVMLETVDKMFAAAADSALSKMLVTVAPKDSSLVAFVPPVINDVKERNHVPLISYSDGYTRYDGTHDTRLVELSKGANPPVSCDATICVAMEHLSAIISNFERQAPHMNYYKLTNIVDLCRAETALLEQILWRGFECTATDGSCAGINNMNPALRECSTKKEVMVVINNLPQAEAKEIKDALIALASNALDNLSSATFKPTSLPIYVYSKDDDAYKVEKLMGCAHRNVSQPAWPYSVIDWLMTCYIHSSKKPSLGDLKISFDTFTTVSLDDVLGSMRYSCSPVLSRNNWVFGGNVFTEVISFSSSIESGENVFCYDVTQWDRNVPRRLATHLYQRLYVCTAMTDSTTSRIAKNFSDGVNGGGTFIFDGQMYNLKKGGFAWCSGANKTLSGNTLMHCAILSVAGIRNAITMGDDGVVRLNGGETQKKMLVNTFNKLGLGLKLSTVDKDVFDFCGVIVRPSRMTVSVNLTKIMRRRYAKMSLTLTDIDSESMSASLKEAFDASMSDIKSGKVVGVLAHAWQINME